MPATVKLEGFRELDKALGELPKATARNTLKRALTPAADHVDYVASGAAPHDTGKLEQSIIVGTKLTSRQAREAKRAGKNFAEIHIGTRLGRGMFTEFGTFKDPPLMWFTRAWDISKNTALEIISANLASEIEKSAARLAKKRAKNAG